MSKQAGPWVGGNQKTAQEKEPEASHPVWSPQTGGRRGLVF